MSASSRNPVVVVLLLVAVAIAVVAAVYSARTAFKKPDYSILPAQGGFPEGSGWIMKEDGSTVPLSEYQKDAESEPAEAATGTESSEPAEAATE